MEKRIYIEITNDKDGYEMNIHNESKSVNRMYAVMGSDQLNTTIGLVVTEMLGEPAHEENEKVALIEANEEKINEYFMEKEYHGTKDGWEDALANWESDLTLSDVKKILHV